MKGHIFRLVEVDIFISLFFWNEEEKGPKWARHFLGLYVRRNEDADTCRTFNAFANIFGRDEGYHRLRSVLKFLVRDMCKKFNTILYSNIT